MSTSLIIIAHNPTASALSEAAQKTLNKELDNLHVFDIQLTDKLDLANQLSKQVLAQTEKEVLILSDLIGASPYNIAKQLQLNLKDKRNIELVTGLNLAMLLKTLNYQYLPADKLAQKALCGGEDCITLNCENHD